jgi:hypothetical protein
LFLNEGGKLGNGLGVEQGRNREMHAENAVDFRKKAGGQKRIAA